MLSACRIVRIYPSFIRSKDIVDGCQRSLEWVLFVINSKRMGWKPQSGRLETTRIPVQKPSLEVRPLMKRFFKDVSMVGFDIWVPTTAEGMMNHDESVVSCDSFRSQ